jgi:thioredoxin 1
MAIDIRGLEPLDRPHAHGFYAIRFAAPLDRDALKRARAILTEAGAAVAGEETALAERSIYLAGPYAPPKADVAPIRSALDRLARDFGAVKATFLVVPTEIDVAAARASEDEDEDEDDENEDDENEEDEDEEDEDEEDEDEDDEDEGAGAQSFWKAGPPPGATETPFPLEGYPDILESFDWEDFGIAVKLGGEPAPGEPELLDELHRFWLTPYVDPNATSEDDEGPSLPFRHARVTHDPRHRASLLWVDRFAVPATVEEHVHHLMWVVSELHAIAPVAHARFSAATMEMKYGELAGDPGPHLVLAGNPLATLFGEEGEAAALAWAESQRTFAPLEVAAMFVELGTHHDPDEPEQAATALRLFERALAIDPANEDAMSYSLLVLVKQARIPEAMKRVAARSGTASTGESHATGRAAAAASGAVETSSDRGFRLFLLGTIAEHAPERIGEAADFVRPEVLEPASGEFFTKFVNAVASHVPSMLAPVLAAVPVREDVVAYLHNAMYGVPDQKAQLAILERTLELPLAAEGPHRAGYLSALNGACVIAHALKDYDLAVRIADRAAEHADENPYIHHSAACAYAAVGRYDDAFRHVKGAVRTNYEHLDRVENDSDLGPILEWPEHKALFADLHARRAKSEPLLEAGDDTFDELVLASDKPVLVDFTASWCGPCQRLAPIVAELARESEGRFRVAKLDVDESQEIAARYEVSSMPTLVVFHRGEERARHVGLTDKKTLRALLAKGGANLD